MTTNNEALALVLDVACLTEDRDAEEQRALMQLALKLDVDFGRIMHTNYRWMRGPRYLARVVGSYEPSDGKRVEPTGAQIAAIHKVMDKWRLCDNCKLPVGAHYADDVCPFLPVDVVALREAVER